jgi:hypothetical protein
MINLIAEGSSNAAPFATSIVGVYTAGLLTILSVVGGIALTNYLRARAAAKQRELKQTQDIANLTLWLRWLSAQVYQVQSKVGIDVPVNPFAPREGEHH